jgi:hypothetical protein
VHSLVFSIALKGESLQGARSITIRGGTVRILSRGELRLVVRVALAPQTGTGVRVAVVHFAQGATARFYVRVTRHGSAVIVRTSTHP